MILFVDDVAYGSTPLAEVPGWQEFGLQSNPTCNLIARRVAACPLRKHNLDECDSIETRWRNAVPKVVSKLKGDKQVCLAWARGPVESDGVLRVMNAVDDWIEDGTKFYFPELVAIGGQPGFYESWLAFEFHEDTFSSLCNDGSIDFEVIRLSLLVLSEHDIDNVIRVPFEAIGIRAVVENRWMAVCHERHFEGCYVIGADDAVSSGIQRVRTLL